MHWEDLEGSGGEGGGRGIGMGNTCKPMAVSFQCMTKSTTVQKIKKFKKRTVCRRVHHLKESVVYRDQDLGAPSGSVREG